VFQRLLLRLAQLDPFGELDDAKPRWERVLTQPRCLQLQRLEPLFRVLEHIARPREKTIAQVALNWLICGERIVAIPGAKNPRQARQNAGVLGWQLTQDERAHIAAAEGASR
jgi:diketogulonate reductase-like aldo/keto reductase